MEQYYVSRPFSLATLISARISNHIASKVLEEIT